MASNYLTPDDYAIKANCNANTVRKWAAKGKIPGLRSTRMRGRKIWLIPEDVKLRIRSSPNTDNAAEQAYIDNLAETTAEAIRTLDAKFPHLRGVRLGKQGSAVGDPKGDKQLTETPLSDRALKELWSTFTDKVYDRLEQGKQEYGDSSLRAPLLTLIREIEEELLDTLAWSFLLWCRLEHIKSGVLDLERRIDC